MLKVKLSEIRKIKEKHFEKFFDRIYMLFVLRIEGSFE